MLPLPSLFLGFWVAFKRPFGKYFLPLPGKSVDLCQPSSEVGTEKISILCKGRRELELHHVVSESIVFDLCAGPTQAVGKAKVDYGYIRNG